MTFGESPGATSLCWYNSNTPGFIIFTPFFMGLLSGSYSRAFK